MQTFRTFELEAMRRFGKECSEYEKRTGDPDDCYFEVAQREEELRRQGRPSKIGILHGRVEENDSAFDKPSSGSKRVGFDTNLD